MNNLRDLLKHEIDDLYSAEEQILSALPGMIEKASNPSLKNSLTEHLRITEQQKNRLDKVLQTLNEGGQDSGNGKKKGILGLFGGKHKCKGMEGIIDEGKKIMGEDMDPDVMDAAIIASAQKVEHYEICGYGTARSYAEELGLQQVAALLEKTLDEEYDADDKLTFLAESRINKQAERNGNSKSGSGNTRSSVRETSKESARTREVEMEPVSTRQSGQSRSTSGSTQKAGAPKGSSARTSTSRSTAAKKTTAQKSASKNSGSTGRGSSGNGRSRGR